MASGFTSLLLPVSLLVQEVKINGTSKKIKLKSLPINRSLILILLMGERYVNERQNILRLLLLKALHPYNYGPAGY
jgi:hypothetical protein